MKIDGQKIRSARIANGLSQTELAKILGCSSQVIYNYEKSKRQPPPEFIKKVSQILNKPIDYFLDRSNVESYLEESRVIKLKILICCIHGEFRFLANEDGVFDYNPFCLDIIDDSFKKHSEEFIENNFFIYQYKKNDLEPRILKGDKLIIQKVATCEGNDLCFYVNSDDEFEFRKNVNKNVDINMKLKGKVIALLGKI